MALWSKGGKGSTFTNLWDKMLHFLVPGIAKQPFGQGGGSSLQGPHGGRSWASSYSHHRSVYYCCVSTQASAKWQSEGFWSSALVCRVTQALQEGKRGLLPPVLAFQEELLQTLFYEWLKHRVFLTVISVRWCSLMGNLWMTIHIHASAVAWGNQTARGQVLHNTSPFSSGLALLAAQPSDWTDCMMDFSAEILRAVCMCSLQMSRTTNKLEWL